MYINYFKIYLVVHTLCDAKLALLVLNCGMHLELICAPGIQDHYNLGPSSSMAIHELELIFHV